MIAKVYVTFKNGVLDPQGKAVHRVLQNLGHEGLLDVRQGKYFELRLSDNLSEEAAREMVETVARTVLANTVIEDFRCELEVS